MKRAHHEIQDIHMAPTPQSASSHVSSKGNAPSVEYPKISRKIRACVECKSRKIKCEMGPGQSICTRCQRLELNCVVNKSLQTLLEDETEWKTTIEQSSNQVQAAVSEILRHLGLPPLSSFHNGDQMALHNSSGASVSQSLQPGGNWNGQRSGDATAQKRRHRTSMAMTRENSQEPRELDEPENDTLVAAPMGSLYEVTKLRNLRSNPEGQIRAPKENQIEEDFISRGEINILEAEELFGVFSRSLNHYLWGGIALVHSSLTSVRKSSSILSAAILAVTALHVPGKTRTFDICYSEFLALVCDTMLDRYHTLDAVRALCIGAFWLSDVSWKLSGHAVRIATELHLHQSFSKAIRGIPEHFERAQLWYFLYVCDHHFSIAYGRPPVIHEDITISEHERFLQLPQITQADHRLHSQVAIFIILARIYLQFGSDGDQEISDESLGQLGQFNLKLDTWRLEWQRRLAPNMYVATYPAKGVSLHYHFAKLQLNSLALRGLSRTSALNMGTERREYANMAVAGAMTTLTLVLDEPDIRNSLVGVPLYLHTMIAFAAVFLLKVQMKWKSIRLGIDSLQVQDLVEMVINLLNDARASERHLTYHIASGLSKMLSKFKEYEMHEALTPSQQQFGTDGMPLGVRPDIQFTDDRFGLHGENGLYGLSTEAMNFYGLDAEYFPLGIFDVLASQMPG